MTTFLAMLRGVNVGGRNRVPMAELRTLAESLGFERVRTYVQSGNVLCEGSTSADQVAAMLSGAIASEFGCSVPVVVRTATELSTIEAANPYESEGLDPNSEPKLFHVTFLSDVPDPSAVLALDKATKQSNQDTFRVVGGEIYLHIPNGYGETKLTNAYFERMLKVSATTRNWRSVTTLAEMARS